VAERASKGHQTIVAPMIWRRRATPVTSPLRLRVGSDERRVHQPQRGARGR
jgi:hypothetical protein